MGFSRARVNGLGMGDPQSRQLWLVPVIATLGRRELRLRNPSASWIYILENVLPKDPRWADYISQCLGTPPLAVDSGVLVFEGPLAEPPAANLLQEKVLLLQEQHCC